jgi:hypothetical protein
MAQTRLAGSLPHLGHRLATPSQQVHVWKEQWEEPVVELGDTLV